ncbi:MAG: MFS transporter [Sphingomonadaceae bacterium]|nr:MFS transporter [Sphingomonadaceae bacterium]
MLASSLAFIDGSVVNVGLPAIGAALHAKAADLQWLVNAYLLPLNALLLLGGAAGDRFGKRNLLLGGTALFALASVLCALAPSLPLLLAGRALQGIGAALLMPNSLSILGSSFAGEEKGRAIGIWAAVGAAAAAVGPVLGGWLIDVAGWRTIFTINLPVAVAAIVMALIAVPEPKSREHAPVDVLGALLVTAGLGVATWGLTMGSGAAGWTTAAIAAAAGGALLLASFLWAERRAGDRAMMPLALFGSRDFVGLSLLTLLLYGALGGRFLGEGIVLRNFGHDPEGIAIHVETDREVGMEKYDCLGVLMTRIDRPISLDVTRRGTRVRGNAKLAYRQGVIF